MCSAGAVPGTTGQPPGVLAWPRGQQPWNGNLCRPSPLPPSPGPRPPPAAGRPGSRAAAREALRRGPAPGWRLPAKAPRPTCPRPRPRPLPSAARQVKQTSGVRRLIFRAAMAWKRKLIRLGARPEDASRVSDALVFHKVGPGALVGRWGGGQGRGGWGGAQGAGAGGRGGGGGGGARWVAGRPPRAAHSHLAAGDPRTPQAGGSRAPQPGQP
jgi:hypothetical protein